MHETEILLGLVVAVAVIVTVSRRTAVPSPVLLVLGGLVLALVPGVPAVRIRPDLVFLLFLPPLLYWESLTSPLREFRRNLLAIITLAIGLVLVSACAVALAARALLPGLSLSAAFVLGALLAPTDEVAVVEVAHRLPIARRTLHILEGESLLNDAVALVIYRMAVGAVTGGSFSLPRGILEFCLVSAGGVAVGLGVGYAVGWVRRRLRDDPLVENTISLLTPFGAYLPAEALKVSSVLAVVSCGLYLGWLGPHVVTSRTRVQTNATWQMLSFLLNGLLFVLTGLQLGPILHTRLAVTWPRVLACSAAMLCLIVALRFVWVFLFATLRALASRRRGLAAGRPALGQLVVISWAGIRGGLSLAAALAIPLTGLGRAPFPERDLMIAVSYFVIMGTLVVQGLTLPWLVRRVHASHAPSADDEALARESALARLHAARAALARLDALGGELPEVPPEEVDRLREQYQARARHFQAHKDGDGPSEHHARAVAVRRLQRELLRAEHEAVVKLRDEGKINDDTLRAIQHEMDFEEVHLHSVREA